ncbi:hypothetical protein LB452_03310 [Psychroflexus sp. CAK8W]|uniref:Chain length determinant protein n=1 Tax=Psychroflexus longus TaxID=2873596 RepID=A0ABS7XG39_9FLAO|nr:hypothetical protein [Psychroflexus longus]MBZ9777942.1 hypothetical protein [Psychroflexus longus]
MSDQSSQNDEIDLSVVFDKIKSIFKSILIGLVQIFQFFWNHKFRLLIVLIIGIGIQLMFSTQVDKIYKNEFLVKTNFGSTEYLYSKAEAINQKIKDKDTVFLSSIFGDEYERIEEVRVDPVVDIYSLVNRSQENKEIFELLLDEYDDISFIGNAINRGEYPTHKISLLVNGVSLNKVLSLELYNYLTNNPYYNDLKQLALNSYEEQLKQNKSIRSQIDSIIKDQKDIGVFPKTNDNAINFTGSQNLRELLSQKQELLDNDLRLKNNLSTNDQVLKIVDSNFGVLSEEDNRSNLIIPASLLFIYTLFFFFRFLKINILKVIKES